MLKGLSKISIKDWKVLLALFLVGFVLFLSLFIRVYRVGDLLGFYYDQGRDALVIWKFLYEGKPFLVGPVTGLEGIFLGPLYYFLIMPFYLIGRGDPTYPSYFLALISVLANAVLFYLGWKMQSFLTGFIALLISSFSYYMVLAGRWLANPTPILLTSVAILLLMWKMVNFKKEKVQTKYLNLLWIAIALLIGMSLQFEAASAIFYIPMIFVFFFYLLIIRRLRVLPKPKILAATFLVFFATLIPQILFNFRHENILFKSFKRVISEEKSFRNPFSTSNLEKKRDYFWSVFSPKIFPGHVKYSDLFYLSSLVGLILAFRKKKDEIMLLLIFIGVAIVGFTFFQGNYGNIYDYYMTGYYLPMILLFSMGLGFLGKSWVGKIIIFIFFIFFFDLHLGLIRNYLSAGVDGPTHITLGNELQAVDWVLNDAKGKEFNLEVYVPPVIPYAYDYLFLWRMQKFCKNKECILVKEEVPILYTLYEADPPHPERLKNWLSRFEGKTFIVEQKKFGGITLEKRQRI